jgi:DNA (cytosine-5)-methyltransferase 1
MKYLSVCSGIEAATVAWHPLGWQPIGFSEIEPFPSAVLSHHYPEVPNFGDMTKYKEWNLGAIDLLVGGTPCQSFSVAGLRKGLEDPRGNLALTYCGILDRFRPQWFVWENVPGVLSSNGGRDFGSFLGALVELGYGFAYRVLDAQYFGVAQRRRRVFVVGCLGNWRDAAAVLFEPESVRGDPAPSRQAGQKVAGTIAASSFDGGAGGRPEGAAGEHFQPYPVANTLTARMHKGINTTLDEGQTPVLSQPVSIQGNLIGREAGGPNGVGASDDGVMYTLTKADVHGVAVAQPMAFAQNTRDEVRYINGDGAITGALAAESGMKQTNYVHQAMAVRRLTPVECERLQGFPDNYTNIPWRKAIDSPDGPRYKALGNSMAVPVMRWIGERIKLTMPKPAG